MMSDVVYDLRYEIPRRGLPPDSPTHNGHRDLDGTALTCSDVRAGRNPRHPGEVGR